MIYKCPCCGNPTDLTKMSVQDAINFIYKQAEKDGYDGYEQMIKFLADNQIDLAIPSCTKVL